MDTTLLLDDVVDLELLALVSFMLCIVFVVFLYCLAMLLNLGRTKSALLIKETLKFLLHFANRVFDNDRQ
jgi:hypothetical protein